jgi:hypothetical protein
MAKRAACTEQAKADIRATPQPAAIQILRTLARFLDSGEGNVKGSLVAVAMLPAPGTGMSMTPADSIACFHSPTSTRVFAIHDEIWQAITTALSVKLSGPGSRRGYALRIRISVS